MSAQPPGMVVEEPKLLDRFPWYVQLLVLLLLILLAIFLIDWFWLAPQRADADTKAQEAESLRQQNQGLSTIATNIEQAKLRLDELNKQLDGLKEKLPEAKEVSNILQQAQREMEAEGLRLLEIGSKSPGGKGGSTEVAKDYYTEVPLPFKVAGTYPNIQGFFRRMAEYTRIVNVTDITVEKLPDTLRQSMPQLTTQATFTVTAFYISPQNRQNLEQGVQPAPEEKGKKKAGTPPPAGKGAESAPAGK